MADQTISRPAEIARARRVKRVNAITTLLSGGLLAAIVFRLAGLDHRALEPVRLMAGFLAGILYANAFEYVLHRFFLHWGEGFLVQRHGLHHDTAGAPEEPRYVNFATSPWVVVLVFVLNAVPVLALEFFFRPGLAAGMFAGFHALLYRLRRDSLALSHRRLAAGMDAGGAEAPHAASRRVRGPVQRVPADLRLDFSPDGLEGRIAAPVSLTSSLAI